MIAAKSESRTPRRSEPGRVSPGFLSRKVDRRARSSTPSTWGRSRNLIRPKTGPGGGRPGRRRGKPGIFKDRKLLLMGWVPAMLLSPSIEESRRPHGTGPSATVPRDGTGPARFIDCTRRPIVLRSGSPRTTSFRNRRAAFGRDSPDRLSKQAHGTVLVAGHQGQALLSVRAGLGGDDGRREGMDSGGLVEEIRGRPTEGDGPLRVGDRLAVLAQSQAGCTPPVVGIGARRDRAGSPPRSPATPAAARRRRRRPSPGASSASVDLLPGPWPW